METVEQKMINYKQQVTAGCKPCRFYVDIIFSIDLHSFV